MRGRCRGARLRAQAAGAAAATLHGELSAAEMHAIFTNVDVCVTESQSISASQDASLIGVDVTLGEVELILAEVEVILAECQSRSASMDSKLAVKFCENRVKSSRDRLVISRNC